MLTFNLITLLKPLNATCGVQHTALTREKRMAFAAHLDAELLPGGTGGKPIAAGTNHLGIREILRVNFLFHLS